MKKNTASSMEILETDVLIIGGGVTGTGVMRDLALRGIETILIDQKDLNAGASGGNHGLLHSGGRYASADTETARECKEEGDILKRLAPECIDDCGGLFVAVEGDDQDFAEKFPDHCAKAGIDCEQLSLAEARSIEPELSAQLTAAYRVPDATVDPFRLTLGNVNHAQQLTNSHYFPHTEILNFEHDSNGSITKAHCRDNKSGKKRCIIARQFVNAGGAWAMKIAEMAACKDISLMYSKGTLIISNTRITKGVVNRLRPPGDGDILVPGGTVSILGTTSDKVASLDNIIPTVKEVDRNLIEGIKMIPRLEHTRFIRAFSGVRPLLTESNTTSDGRKASRGFHLFDHESQGVDNFVTITGGKLTTFRLMAEKTGNLVAQRLANNTPCQTTSVALPDGAGVRWTKPGYAARIWYKNKQPSDMILCECEMVSQSAVDDIIASAPGSEEKMTLQAIGLRSRIGKGSCQGSFCAIRVASYLYQKDIYNCSEGLHHIQHFVDGRFKGVKPVLWGEQMAQMELAEALHCGLMGLDKLTSDDSDCHAVHDNTGSEQ